ncbi:hypothetical protein OAA09_00975 [bacterium]|nr:hypothetical protein [bacterium]
MKIRKNRLKKIIAEAMQKEIYTKIEDMIRGAIDWDFYDETGLARVHIDDIIKANRDDPYDLNVPMDTVNDIIGYFEASNILDPDGSSGWWFIPDMEKEPLDEAVVRKIREALTVDVQGTVAGQIQKIRSEKGSIEKKLSAEKDSDNIARLKARLKDLIDAESELSATDIEDPDELPEDTPMTTVESLMSMSALKDLIRESAKELEELSPVK